MRLLNSLIMILCAATITARAQTIDIHVATGGDDRNSGTAEAPVASLHKAWEIARSYASSRTINIYCHEGTHRLQSPLVIDASGSEKHPVNISAFPGEKAVVTSLQPIRCKWAHYRDGIFSTPVDTSSVSHFDGLFVDGVTMHMARYPDYDPDVAIFNGFAADAIDSARTARWADPRGAYLHVMHGSEWGGYQYIVNGKNPDGTLQLGGGFQNNRMSGMHPRYRMVENVFEELDAPGEWYFDRNTATLYLRPLPGTDLTEAVVEAPQSESLFIVLGTPQKPVAHINISDLEMCGTLRTFMKTAEPLLRSDWKIYRGGALLFENTEHCSVTDCHIDRIGGNAIFFSGYNRHGKVARNHIEHVGASAVCFVGCPDAVRSPLFEYGQSNDWATIDTIPGPCSENYPSMCVVDNNLIHSIGETEKQGAGIQLSMSMDITVSHNSIYDLPRAGINISEGTWGGHVIEWNDVFNTVRETGDHGSFNSWGRDRYWHPDRSRMDTIVAHNPEAPYLDAIHTTVIRNNRWRCDHGWDIDLDDGSSNYHIYNNLCLNGGLKLREGFHRTVENNVIVNNSFHPHVWFAGSRDAFRRNIVTTEYFPIGITDWGTGVDSNFFATAQGLDKAQLNGTDAHSLAGDPQFVDPGRGDYRVAPSSPAIKVGFINFDMDSFGVIHEPLRTIAATPELPELRIPDASGSSESAIFRWNGLSLKSVTTEGERSATGIDSVRGVIVLANTNPEIDLRPNDVVLEINGRSVDGVDTLRDEFSSGATGFSIIRFRNQEANAVTLPAKNPD